MSKLGDFDINELILQLYSELKFAFETTHSAERDVGLRMENVNVRFGRKINIELNSSENEEPEYVELLNGQRYPNEEDWELEVNYKQGLPMPNTTPSQNWVSSLNSKLIIQRLGTTPIIHIKGVSQVWQGRFESDGVLTVDDLVSISTSNIQTLCRKYNSLQPLEFQVKTLLLIRDFRPLRTKQLNQMPLTTFLESSKAVIQVMSKNKLSGPEISELKAMASIIYLVFDKSFTSKLKLEILAL